MTCLDKIFCFLKCQQEVLGVVLAVIFLVLLFLIPVSEKKMKKEEKIKK